MKYFNYIIAVFLFLLAIFGLFITIDRLFLEDYRTTTLNNGMVCTYEPAKKGEWVNLIIYPVSIVTGIGLILHQSYGKLFGIAIIGQLFLFTFFNVYAEYGFETKWIVIIIIHIILLSLTFFTKTKIKLKSIYILIAFLTSILITIIKILL